MILKPTATKYKENTNQTTRRRERKEEIEREKRANKNCVVKRAECSTTTARLLEYYQSKRKGNKYLT